MKKTFLCMMFAAVFIVSGCGQAVMPQIQMVKPEERVVRPEWLTDDTKIWDISIDQPEYVCLDKEYGISWEKDGELLKLRISPAEGDDQADLAGIDGLKTIEKDGRKFYIVGNTEDGYYDWMRWLKDGYVYALGVRCMDKQNVQSYMNAETALTVEQGGIIPGFEISDKSATAEFTFEHGYVFFTICLSPYGEKAIANLLNRLPEFHKTYKQCEDEGLQYYLYDDKTGMIWNTDKGPIGIEKEWDDGATAEERSAFMNADFARKLTELLGAKILPLPPA